MSYASAVGGIPLRYRTINGHCVLAAFCNVCDLDEDFVAEKLKVVFEDSYMSFKELAPIAERLGIQLAKQPLLTTLEELVNQEQGLFLVNGGVHTVGVDCANRLIYDSGKETTVPLSVTALHDCSIPSALEIRKVIMRMKKRK